MIAKYIYSSTSSQGFSKRCMIRLLQYVVTNTYFAGFSFASNFLRDLALVLSILKLQSFNFLSFLFIFIFLNDFTKRGHRVPSLSIGHHLVPFRVASLLSHFPPRPSPRPTASASLTASYPTAIDSISI